VPLTGNIVCVSLDIKKDASSTHVGFGGDKIKNMKEDGRPQMPTKWLRMLDRRKRSKTYNMRSYIGQGSSNVNVSGASEIYPPQSCSVNLSAKPKA
jgi:hypothetical protein